MTGVSTRKPTLDGLTDVSDRFAVHVSNVRFDHVENLIVFDIMVTNKSDATIADPTLVLMENAGSLLNLRANNADNGKNDDSALWELKVPSGELGCERTTEPRTLTFRAEGSSKYVPYNVPLRIYGKQP